MPFPPDAPKKIRDKLDSGALPVDAPAKMFAGYGKGLCCDGCETKILPVQVEYELELPDGRTFRLHLGCAGLWEADRRRRGWSKPEK